MIIQRQVPLTNYNTFGIAARAGFFVSICSVEELVAALGQKAYPRKFILGGGSNLLFTQDVPALVIHINTMGKEIVNEDENTVTLRIAAGENWHQVVLWTIEHGFGGLENLSLIPGKVGAAPIQNIGAYGVELKDVFVECEAVSIHTLQRERFSREACEFGYRDSIFKGHAKGNYVIISVTLRLTKKEHHIKTEYGAIQNLLQAQGITQPTLKEISNAVIAIRSSKLPNPSELGNSGSFFKNPFISRSQLEQLQKEYPTIPFYPTSDESFVKIPAGWLIEQCGFKGKRVGDAGVYEKQALVLVNYGSATGKDILELAHTIQKEIANKFHIHLEPEVNII